MTNIICRSIKTDITSLMTRFSDKCRVKINFLMRHFWRKNISHESLLRLPFDNDIDVNIITHKQAPR